MRQKQDRQNFEFILHWPNSGNTEQCLSSHSFWLSRHVMQIHQTDASHTWRTGEPSPTKLAPQLPGCLLAIHRMWRGPGRPWERWWITTCRKSGCERTRRRYTNCICHENYTIVSNDISVWVVSVRGYTQWISPCPPNYSKARTIRHKQSQHRMRCCW